MLADGVAIFIYFRLLACAHVDDVLIVDSYARVGFYESWTRVEGIAR